MQRHWHYNLVLYSLRRISTGRSGVQDNEIEDGREREMGIKTDWKGQEEGMRGSDAKLKM